MRNYLFILIAIIVVGCNDPVEDITQDGYYYDYFDASQFPKPIEK